MICGNDPRVKLTPGDRAVVEWFQEYLTWSATPEAERGPEPAAPDGYLVSQDPRSRQAPKEAT